MTDGTWIRVASMSDVEPGGAKAVRLGEGGRGVALFNRGREDLRHRQSMSPHGLPSDSWRGAQRHGHLRLAWAGS